MSHLVISHLVTPCSDVMIRLTFLLPSPTSAAAATNYYLEYLMVLERVVRHSWTRTASVRSVSALLNTQQLAD